jgi:TaqI-like C-terminal specificity domain/Eco57I restriction-modification methylase
MVYDVDLESNDGYNDIALTYKDVQELSSREKVVAFFGRLHYDISPRMRQTLAAMNFTSDNLSNNVKAIERIALHDDVAPFAVYLFEVRSMTVSLRNEIVQRFRNGEGDYLLVLTDDYQRLDFVLVEHYTQTVTLSNETVTIQQLPLGNKPVSARPHVLQVERSNPGEVALRVLRRFTYTEQDTLTQYEKLLNAYIVATWSSPYFNNHALFSDYYLTERLRDEVEWTDNVERMALRKAYKSLRSYYDNARNVCTGKPVQVLRQNLVEPIFEMLGFSFKAQSGVRVQSDDPTTAFPDYRLYDGSTGESGRAQGRAPTEKNTRPLALCLTYPWGRNLDGKDDLRDEQTAGENPGAVVVTLLDGGGADWVMLTNGIIWRLYAAKAHSRATNYYEINLPETLSLDASRREDALRYFWLLFRKVAFLPIERAVVGERRSLSLLDYLLVESDLHARALGERLKNRVFEEIFPHFALGFVNYARQHKLLPVDIEAWPAEERNRLLEPFFNGTLNFLYRLLFLFYAESRDLLPVRQERKYYEQSLQKLKMEIAQDAGRLQDRVEQNLRDYSETGTELYDRLMLLFHALDKGNPTLNVPIYNGGLFLTDVPPHQEGEPAEITVARFLAEHKMPDRQLALGLDLMARDVDERMTKERLAASGTDEYSHELVFIDYKSLGVRHLGSIYEGLLEFKLRVAPEEMAVVEGKRTEEIVPYTEAMRTHRRILKIRQGKELKERLIKRGAIYLENDRRERKASGSYYTPDYIVKYIVEQTVGPILKQKLDRLRVVFRHAQQDLYTTQQNWRGIPHKWNNTTPEHQIYKRYSATLNDAFFDIKVLDPAMGSGHFPVEVVDYITDQMAKWLNAYKWNPIVYEMGLTRKAIEEDMKKQNVTIDFDKLTDLNLLKRRVLKSCIYGVDLNPMAVELTRVSLWLDCFTLGAPLSFLDHHIKCGNSLIGAEVSAVLKDIKANLFGYQFGYLLDAAQLMRGVSKRSDVTAKEVAESRQAYQQADDVLRPHKRLFNVWLSQYFSNRKKEVQEIASQYAQNIVDDNYAGFNESDVKAIKAATAIASSKRFFHWELEFPEIYFDEHERKEDGGFDAVVGNPPYVRQEGLGDDKTAFKELYTVYNSIADLYTYFIERAHTLLRPGGRFSMITANKFMRANYGMALRKFLTSNIRLEQLINFGELRVFEEAATDPLITVSSKNAPGSSVSYVQVKNLQFSSLNEVVASQALPLQASTLAGPSWTLTGASQQAVLDKMQKNTLLLKNYSNRTIEYGIKTGFNEAFVIDSATRTRLITEDPASTEIIKPFLVGDDIRRYYADFKDQYVIFTRRGINIKNYSAIEQYLLQYRKQLEPRPRNWNSKIDGEWLGRKPGPYKWYEIQDNVAYYADFEQPKIIYPVIAMSGRFSFDENGYYSNDKTFIIPTDDKYLLALLNSNLVWSYLVKICSVLGDADEGGRLELRSVHVETTPIRRINYVTPNDKRAYYQGKAHLLYQQCLQEHGKPDCIMGFVDHHLAQQPEASDVVRDLLALLAEEMLCLNKEKRALQQEFLTYLVDALHIKPDKDGRAGVEALTGKSRLLDYAGDYQKGEDALLPDDLWELVRKNRARVEANLAQASLKERVLMKYQQSLDKVLPLKEQLRHTDALIDRVVYRLYGLTEEEIAVVEGREV